jgi:SAM-dependent methyltransferase
MHFDQFAGDYEQVLDETVAVSGEDSAYFAAYKAFYLCRVLPHPFPGKILDFGCGIGLLSRFLKTHLPSARVDGCDLSRDSINKIDAFLKEQGVFTANAAELGHDYQLIVVANVMHHVAPDARARLVQNLADRLVPGGLLSIFEHNPANPVTRWVVKHCPFDEDAILLSPTETQSYVTHANLNLMRRDYIVFMPRLLSWLRPMERWLAWLPLGAQYVLLAQKNA